MFSGGRILQMLTYSYDRYGCSVSYLPLGLITDDKIHKTICDLNREFLFNLDFDVIIASEVLKRLQNPYNVLEKVREHLTKDGLFFVINLSVTLWRCRIQILRGKFPKYDLSHIGFWDIDSFIKLLISYGYEVLNFYPTYFVFPRYLGRIFFIKPGFLYRLFEEQFLFLTSKASQI